MKKPQADELLDKPRPQPRDAIAKDHRESAVPGAAKGEIDVLEAA